MTAIFLYILSFILKFPFSFIGIIYGLFTNTKKTKAKFYEMAQSNDRFINGTCAELFNRVLITKESLHKFGDSRETVSSVLGRNKKAGTLSKHGLWWDNKLNKIDPDHTTKAIGWRPVK